MPLFKVINVKLNGDDSKVPFRVLVNESGTFTCKVPERIHKALGIAADLEFSDFKSISHEIYNICEAFDLIHTTTTFHIMYRMAFTRRIKNQVPEAIMNPDIWKKTQRMGSEYMSEDDLGLIIDWYPTAKIIVGKNIEVQRIGVADEEAVEYSQKWPWIKLYKPFSELLFVTKEKHWNFNDQYFFEVALTEETYNFFTGIEAGLVGMLTKMIGFLSMDEVKLLEFISNMTKLNEGKENQFLIS